MRPLAIAITGGIGAGKSEALKAFARHGAATASADEIVHRLYARPEVRAELVGRWGEGILEDGSVSRARIAEIVFSDRDELDWLERYIHPLVVEEQRRWRERQQARLVAIEIPLLYETGGETRFDAVVVITAPEDVRSRRARVPTAGRAERLLPDEEKVRRADFAYVNDGSLEELDAFVGDVVAELEAHSR